MPCLRPLRVRGPGGPRARLLGREKGHVRALCQGDAEAEGLPQLRGRDASGGPLLWYMWA